MWKSGHVVLIKAFGRKLSRKGKNIQVPHCAFPYYTEYESLVCVCVYVACFFSSIPPVCFLFAPLAGNLGLHSRFERQPEGEPDREQHAGADAQDRNITGKLWEFAESVHT